jgi:integrase
MTFHSFRHTFTDYVRRPDIPEGIQRQLVGHSSKDVHDDYGSGYNLYWLAEAMKLYKVPGLKVPDPAPMKEAA